MSAWYMWEYCRQREYCGTFQNDDLEDVRRTYCITIRLVELGKKVYQVSWFNRLCFSQSISTCCLGEGKGDCTPVSTQTSVLCIRMTQPLNIKQ